MPLDGMPKRSAKPAETWRATFSEDVLLANLAIDFNAAAEPLEVTATVLFAAATIAPVTDVAEVADAVRVGEMNIDHASVDLNLGDSRPVAVAPTAALQAIEPEVAFAPTRAIDFEVPSNHAEFARYIDALEARLAEHAAGAESPMPAELEPRVATMLPVGEGACAFGEGDLSLDIPEELDSVQLGAFLDVLTQTMLGLPGAIDVFCRVPERDDARVKPLALLDQLAQQAQGAGIRGIHTFASRCRNLVEALAGSGLATSHASFGTLRRGVAVLKQMSNAVWGAGSLELDVAEVLDELIEAEFRALVDVTTREQTRTVSLSFATEPLQSARGRVESDNDSWLLDRLLPHTARDRLSRA